MSRGAALLAAALAAAAAGPPPERFASWSLTCVAAGTGCALSQIVAADPQGRHVVLGVVIDLRDDRAVPTIRFRLTPHAQTRAGLGVKVDGQPELRLAIAGCTPDVCEASGRLAGMALGLFETGRVAQVAFLGPDGEQEVAPVRLEGLRQALAALRHASGAP